MELTATKYEQTEVGLIPEDWEVKVITETTKKIFLGLTSKVDYVKTGGYPLVRATDIANGLLDFTKALFISTEQHLKLTKYSISSKGDVLVSKSGSLGVCCIVNTEKKFSTYESIITISPSSTLDSDFLLWLIRYEGTQRRMLGDKVGSSVSHLNLQMFRELEIPLPTLNEQKAIAQVLSDTDALIQALDKKIAKKKLIKKGVMQKLLTPKEGWITAPLTESVDYIHGKAHEQYIVKTGKYVVVNSKYISRNGTVVKYSNSNFCKAKSGDLLTVLSDLPNGKALAKCFYVSEDDKYAVNQRICIWRPKKDKHPMFLKYLLNRHKYFLSLDDGVTQTHILNHHIEKCEISIPNNFDEQKQIGNVLFDIDKEISQLEQKRVKYQLAKQGMMQQLLTGKIRLV